ncbi:hypothetical protein DdX_14236 [Ditylenchus destructor]|uniref:Uncharacterized protein n=1 Tax=Ditylenchus destructor TaxID=166010 RepID=A0AAD4MXG6_9BILA|nr:hypothetical protein DdX_14236 [Ditylenchus destructor]
MTFAYVTYLSLAENCLVLSCLTVTTATLILLLYRYFYKPHRLMTRTFSKPMFIFLCHHLINSVLVFPYHFYLVFWWNASKNLYQPYILFWSGIWISNYWAINPAVVFFLALDRCLAIILVYKYSGRLKRVIFFFEAVTLACLYTFSTYTYLVDLPLNLNNAAKCQSFPCLLVRFNSVPQLSIKMCFGYMNIVASALFFYLIKNASYNINNRVVVVSVVCECAFNVIPGSLSFIFTMITGETWAIYLGPIGSTLLIVDASVLGSGRVIRQSLLFCETRRLVPVLPTKIDSAGIYGFRKILDDQGRRHAAKPLGSPME